MSISPELPQYQSHEKVRALKIALIEQSPPYEVFEDGSWSLVPAHPAYGPITVGHGWFSKHMPEEGGYYVVYADGFTSYSPAAALESGYVELEVTPAQLHDIQEKYQFHDPEFAAMLVRISRRHGWQEAQTMALLTAYDMAKKADSMRDRTPVHDWMAISKDEPPAAFNAALASLL